MNQTLESFEINPDADTAGIRPQDITDGIAFVLDMDDSGNVCTVNQRASRTGGEFKQYTLHGTVNGEKRRLSFLFEKQLAPIAREFGRNPAAWVGKTLFVTGVPRGNYWDVTIQPKK
jgi:hypothetical protein